ncbi:hypothetical protein BGX34_010028 [Mortierella sp. NVP85]|nr:hypothetical protein BGX34_010028 [Mortierella sp. NVP85]
MQDLVYFLFPPGKDSHHKFTENAVTDLYTHLKPAVTEEPPPGIQPQTLKPQLLPFQRRTVAWCLNRECRRVADNGKVEYKEPAIAEKLPISWEQILTPSGSCLFINRLCGLLCYADPDLVVSEPEPRGGILAEEMGLGKTVEVLALILLNRRIMDTPVPASVTLGSCFVEQSFSESHQDNSTRPEASPSTSCRKEVKVSEGASLIESSATLIITPLSIIYQWASEIENHAPNLRVFIYDERAHEQTTAEQLAKYDVVLTTYTVLSKEVNYTNQCDRPRRHERQYVPRKSPFIQIEWWRVCLDEAQMIEGGTVSQAANMAFMIPRVLSWAISGTPIRRTIEDLQSLLTFLGQEPIASNRRLWRLLTAFSFRSTFVSCHQRIMHRYAKKDVVQELAIPPQLRLVYNIHFTEIERANYNQKWEECLSECNVMGANVDSEEAERLQSWFMRLRQTCCHPHIGSRNKESLGKTNLRTIDEVLDAMVQQNKAQLHIKERTLFTTKLKRAVLTARIHNDIAEMQLFTQLAVEAQRQVESWDTKLREQRGKRAQSQGPRQSPEEKVDIEQEPLDCIDFHTRLDINDAKPSADDPYTANTLRHRDWQEQHHRVLFFSAGFYHDLDMGVEEVELYARAEEVRQQILAPSEKKFEKLLVIVKSSMQRVELGESYMLLPSKFKGGIVLGRHLEELEFMRNLLNQQLTLLNQWRQDLIHRLTQPLMQDGEEGEQYQYSIDLQHTLESYLHYYGRMLTFRRDLISGTEETVAKHVANVQSQNDHESMVKRREDRIRSLTRKHEDQPNKEENLDKRLEMDMNRLITPDLVSTLRSIRTDIKSLVNDMSLAHTEKQMAAQEDLRLKDEQNHQSKLVLELEKEVSLFRALTAARTVYYRQLQAISDTVRDVESLDPEKDIDVFLEEETKLQADIVRLISKQRYLEHLAGVTGHGVHSDDEQLCLICRSHYNMGLMTECGHVFLAPNSEIDQTGSTSRDELPLEPSRDRQHRIMRLVPEAIRRMPILDGYGSKIDGIVRHIMFLVREDPETKCLVFSQWSSLLKLVSESLLANQIGFVKLDGASVKTAVRQFNEDRNKQVFMLHAKSQSAGLTLLSATHVFICEPLVNPVLQAQATYVHYYLIQDTVEIPCFDLFERNQSAALMADHDVQDTAATAADITNAQDRNGELVKLDDLKFCFQMQKQMNSKRESSSY